MAQLPTPPAQPIRTQPTTLQNTDLAQQQFLLGMSAMVAGDFERAVAVFERLYVFTRTPRVKLEWARAAFLAKRFSVSKRLFNEVLDEGVPDAVRFNVGTFLQEIDKLGAAANYGFTLVRDTNPFAASAAQVVYIFGIPFAYRPPDRPQTLYGLNAYGTYSATINEAGTVRWLVEGNLTQYQGPNNNKGLLGVAAQFQAHLGSSSSWRLGYEDAFQRGKTLQTKPYVSYSYRGHALSLDGGVYQRGFDVRYALVQYPDYPNLNGEQKTVNVSGSTNVMRTLQVGATLTWDGVGSKTLSQANETVGATVYARAFSRHIGSHITLSHSESNRKFGAPDELFVVTRRDRREVTTLAIQPYGINIRGLYPNIEIGVETSNSSVTLNNYQREFVNMSLRKSF